MQHACKQYDYNIYTSKHYLSAIKIKNLKNSKSVNLSPVNLERVFPMGYPHFLFRHTFMPMSGWFGSAVVPCGSLSSL